MMPTQKYRLSVTFPDGLFDEIIDYQEANGLQSQSSAIIELLSRSLSEAKKKGPPVPLSSRHSGEAGSSSLGMRIKERRKELGLSAEKLAEILGRSTATIYRYENGDIEKVPADLLDSLSSALLTTPGALMGWEEDSRADAAKSLDYTSIADKIKSRRSQLGYSLAELAELSGVNRSTLQRYESGAIKNIPLSRLQTLSAALLITPGALLGWEEDGCAVPTQSKGDCADLVQAKVDETCTSSLSAILKQRRNVLGLTLAQIADSVGVSEATVSRWESGDIRSVRHERVAKLSDVLGVPPSVLMGCAAPDEACFLALLRRLNEEGRDRLSEYMDFLTSLEKYVRDDLTP